MPAMRVMDMVVVMSVVMGMVAMGVVVMGADRLRAGRYGLSVCLPPAQTAPAPDHQPDTDQRQNRIADRRSHLIGGVNQLVARPAEQGDARIDQRHRNRGLGQAGQNGNDGKRPQADPRGHAIAADQHLAMTGTHGMEHPIGKGQPQQPRQRAGTVSPQLPDGTGQRRLNPALRLDGLAFHPGQPAGQPQQGQQRRKHHPQDQERAGHVRRTSSE